MASKKYKEKAKVWLWPGDAPWHLVSLSKKNSHDIKEKYGKLSKGFGSFPVEAKIGKTVWKTSIFPDRKTYIYMLPIKKDVRRKEGIFDGDSVAFTIEIKI